MKKLIAVFLTFCLLFSSISALALSRNFTAIEISEIMASNKESLRDSNDKGYDWFELHNTSDEEIDLEGLCLSDGKKNLKKFVFPAGITLPADGYMIIFCSGEESVETLEDGSVEIHTSFKLSAKGEKVVVSYQDVILDLVKFDEQEKDVSYAKQQNGSWKKTSDPTPGEKNY